LRVNSLLYHDVIAAGDYARSGFPGAGADLYKLDTARFRADLEALRAVVPDAAPATIDELLAGASKTAVGRAPLLLTFDDGGLSAATHIAPELERFGWRGHFFITTDRIGTPAFLDGHQIRCLHARGHVVGSHSCSHPRRMSDGSFASNFDEWRRSLDLLSDLLSTRVATASIPGGFYSLEVARAAAAAGVRALFTSEPTSRTWRVDDCMVLGRFAVHQRIPTARVLAYANGSLAPIAGLWLSWNIRKAAKLLAGPHYLRFREHWLQRSRDRH
jgi:peptidoglycan/xylan/chitin deacetylase (PgdA/CDA1 family)